MKLMNGLFAARRLFNVGDEKQGASHIGVFPSHRVCRSSSDTSLIRKAVSSSVCLMPTNQECSKSREGEGFGHPKRLGPYGVLHLLV